MENLSSKDIWLIHEQRFSDNERKIDDNKTCVVSIEKELRQLIERINMGISPTQNKILEKSSNIELKLTELDHKFEMKFSQFETRINVDLFDIKNKQDNHDEWFKSIKTIFVSGILMVLVGAITLTIYNRIVDSKDQQKISIRK